MSALSACACAFMVAASPAQEVPKSVSVVARTGPLQGVTSYTDSFALFIGISDYHNDAIKQLPSAENDAVTMRRILVTSFGFNPDPGHTVVLLGAQATRANIISELARLSDTRRIKPTDRVLVYYSGHGERVPLPNGEESGYLIPYDASVKLDDVSNPSEYQASCLDVEDIVKRLKFSPARHRALILDSCFSGFATGTKGLGDGKQVEPDMLKRMLDERGLAIMTAGTSRDEALASMSRTGLSAFTRCIVDALTKAEVLGGTFTLGELASDVKKRTIELTNRTQNPQYGVSDSVGEMILFPTGSPTLAPTSPVEKRVAVVKKNRKTGADFVFVEEGEFKMGGEANPEHMVFLDGYWIGKNLVTVGEFKAYCKDRHINFAKFQTPHPEFWHDDQPMVNVTWEEARAYCQWAGGDLPTEAQWEKAARGVDGRKYPWGDTFDASRLWSSKEEIGDALHTAPAGSYTSGVSPFGCFDMAGNVNQWCYDGFADYSGQPERNPTGPSYATKRVLRGGDWLHFNKGMFLSSARESAPPETRNEYCGFRVVCHL